ncbi:MAG: hypothetical protein IPM82_07275 [Saprospiraceae bacterium]|nr:hypothetical protein [Saprospiraceae bacterium]
MKVKDLHPEVLANIKNTRYDRIIEKHEGPFTWDWQLNRNDPKTLARMEEYKRNGIEYEPEADAEFLQIGDADVLLPVSSNHHPNMTILHHFFSEDRSKIVAYIKDTTYDDSMWGAGFVAICDRYEGHDFYLAKFYHEWFIIDYNSVGQ